MPLAHCLEKHKFPAQEAAIITAAADEYIKKGDTVKAAGIRAVTDFVNDFEKSRTFILDQVEKKLGIKVEESAPSAPVASKIEDADEKAPEKKGGDVDDFGEKIGGARKDQKYTSERKISDDDIANLPLSKIWPKDEIEKIEDDFTAALFTAARAEIPSKPRTSYKVRAWVDKVKLYRGLLESVTKNATGSARDLFIRKIQKETPSLTQFLNKVLLLESVPREHWERIDSVAVNPGAYRYEDGKQIPSPYADIRIDGRYQEFRGVSTIDETIPLVLKFLGEKEKSVKVPLKFEIRRSGTSYFINKKGDPEYRKLKTFDSVDAARTYLSGNRDDLVAAWEDIKNRDNVKKTDVRGEENRPRVGKDRRNGEDVTSERFEETFGFRGGVFGNWVSQGKGNKDRQGMLNQAFDAFSDLADILGVPPKALSLNGTLGLSFGASGSGWASAHYSSSHLAINLTKTRGAGALAHEFFHALDNYFSNQRGGAVAFTGNQEAYRRDNYITYKPEPLMVNKKHGGSGYTKARLAELRASNPSSGYLHDIDNWVVDPHHREGVRPEVELAFAELVETINNSPMAKRASAIDKGKSGYWSRVVERAARSFENYVIEKMTKGGYHNDYLANVVDIENFQRDKGRYPYLLPEEIKPVEDAFDNLFSTLKTKQTDKGVALYADNPTAIMPPIGEQREIQNAIRGKGMVDVARFIRDSTDKEDFKLIAEKVVSKLIRARAVGIKLDFNVSEDGTNPSLGAGRGVCLTEKNKISIIVNGPDVANRSGMSHEIILHELIHAATEATLADSRGGKNLSSETSAAVSDLKELMFFLRNRFNERIASGADLTDFERQAINGEHNAFANDSEVIAWVFTNGSMQQYMESIEYKKQTVWQKFVSAIRRMLGLNPTKETALSEILRIGEKIINENPTRYEYGQGDDLRRERTERMAPQGDAQFSKNSGERGRGNRGEIGKDNSKGDIPGGDGKVVDNDRLTTSTPETVTAAIAAKLGKSRTAALLSGPVEILRGQEEARGIIEGLGAKLSAAFHGSPHDFEKFRSSAIGTGEGAQAYGYGLYFAGSKAVAEYYRKTLSSPKSVAFALAFKDIFPEASPALVREIFRQKNDSPMGMRSPVAVRKAGYALADERAFIEENQERLWDATDKAWASPAYKGRLYEVELAPQPEDYLLWDKPLSEQSEKVRAALRNVGGFFPQDGDQSARARVLHLDDIMHANADKVSGKTIYRELGSNDVLGDKAASEYLHSLGIRGIKYLDGSSRSKGEGAYNYVIFDESDVEIKVKYAKDGQTIQGMYANGKAYLVADGIEKDNEIGVLLHELGDHARQLGFKNDKEYQSILKTLEMRSKFNDATGKAIQAAMALVPSDTAQGDYWSEVSGYLVESEANVKLSIVERILNFFKKLAIKVGLPSSMLTHKDIVMFAQSAVRAASGVSAFDGVKQSVRDMFKPVDVESDNPLSLKLLLDGLVRDADFLSDFADTDAFKEFGLGGFDIPSKRIVADRVISMLNNNKVLDSIVESVPVDVVNILRSQNLSPKVLFHDSAMLSNLLTGDGYDTVSSPVDAPSLVVRVVARGAAKALSVVFGDQAGASRKLGSTGETVNLDSPIHGRKITGVSAKSLVGVKNMRFTPLERGAAGEAGVDGHSVSPRNFSIQYNKKTNKSTIQLFSDTDPRIQFSKAEQPKKLNATPAPAFNASTPTTQELPAETKFQAALRKFQDRYNRVQVLEDFVGVQGVSLPEKAKVSRKLATMNGKVADQLKRFLDQTIEPLVERAGKLKVSVADLADYLLMQHVKEANDQARKRTGKYDALAYGIPDDEARDALREYRKRADFAQFSALAEDFRKLSDDTADLLEQEGIVTPDMRAAWNAAYKKYVPVRGDGSKPSSARGVRVSGRQPGRHGHERRNENVIENIVKMREFAIKNIEKNRVGASIAQFLVEANDDRIGEISKPKARPVYKAESLFVVQYKGSPLAAFPTQEEADRYMQRDSRVSGQKISDYDVSGTADPFAVWMVSPVLKDNEVNFYLDGKQVRLTINDEVAANALTNLGQEGLGTLLSTGKAINNYFSRAYTGYDPRFTIRNTFRDFTAGMINLAGDYGTGMAIKIAANYPSAVREFVRARNDPAKSQWVDRYRKQGGSTGASWLPSIEKLGEDIEAMWHEQIGAVATYNEVFKQAKDNGSSTMAARAKALAKSGVAGFHKVPVLGHFLKLIEMMNAVSENAFRVAVFKTLVENGKTEAEAGEAAKNSTINFDKRGELGAQMGALWLFFNPAVQGMHRTGTALFKSKHKHQAQALVGSMALVGFMAAELGMMMGGDDEEEWQKVPRNVKSRNLVVSLGGGKQITIPLPYEYGAFVGIGTAMNAWAHGKADHRTALDVAGAIIDGLSPLGNPVTDEGALQPLNMMPTMVKVLLAPTMNMNSFGNPIAPKKYDEHKPDSQNMWRGTKGSFYDTVATGLNAATGGNKYESGVVDVSPEVLKFYTRTILGGAATFVDQVVGLGVIAANGAQPDVAEIPMVSVLARENTVRDSRREFWDIANRASQAVSAYKMAVKNKDPQTAAEIKSENGPLMQVAKVAETQAKLAKAKRDAIDAIRLNDKMSFAEKRDKTKRIEAEEERIYDKLLKKFNAIN
jgi:hypothetical protein